MQAFAKSHSFSHCITSSLHYHQSNGMVEKTVRTVNQLLRNAPDPYLALLSYRATSLPRCDKSPSELLMERKYKQIFLRQMNNFFQIGHFSANSGRRTWSIREGKRKIMISTTTQGC